MAIAMVLAADELHQEIKAIFDTEESMTQQDIIRQVLDAKEDSPVALAMKEDARKCKSKQ